MDCCICISFAMSSGLVRNYVIILVHYIVKWWCFKIFKYFPIYFLRADFIYLSIFRYGFFDTFLCEFGGDFSCLYICCFG